MADEQVGVQMRQRGFQSLHDAFDAAVDVNQQNFSAQIGGHARFRKVDSGVALTVSIR